MSRVFTRCKPNHNTTVKTCRWLLVTALCLLGGLLSGCVNTPKRVTIVELPAVDPSQSAMLRFRSVDNLTTVKHHHIIRINEQPVVILKADEKANFEVAEGSQSLHVTCHSRYEGGDATIFPFRYSVIDGQARKQIDVQAGDDLCFKIAFAVTNCATLVEAEPSYCD